MKMALLFARKSSFLKKWVLRYGHEMTWYLDISFKMLQQSKKEKEIDAANMTTSCYYLILIDGQAAY